jgi:hypothetical protein
VTFSFPGHNPELQLGGWQPRRSLKGCHFAARPLRPHFLVWAAIGRALGVAMTPIAWSTSWPGNLTISPTSGEDSGCDSISGSTA